MKTKPNEKQWIFVCNMGGVYFPKNCDEFHTGYKGPSFYLGVDNGITREEAFAKLYNKKLTNDLPDLKDAKVWAYEVLADDGPDYINIEKALSLYDESNPLVKFEDKKCEWCGDSLPSNGAAQFSHLRKHVKQLLKANIISEQIARDIHSIKLNKEINDLFLIGKAQNVFKAKIS